MVNVWKRSLSMLMAVLMVFSLLPSHAIAAELADDDTTIVETNPPAPEETDPPVPEETDPPVPEETDPPVPEETDPPVPEETDPPKAELSGETRKIYFHNVEGWDEVWAAWSFDEEDFEDVAHPGAEMTAAAVLEEVYVVTLPEEADEVLFSDGIEVTAELLEEEEKAGQEVTHEIAVSLDESDDLYVNGAWEDYAAAVRAKQAADAEAAAKAAEEAAKQAEEEPAADAAVTEVQAMINALPVEFNSQDEVDTFWDVTCVELDAAIEALTPEQQAMLDTSNYDAAIDAAASYTNPEFDDATAWNIYTLTITDNAAGGSNVYSFLADNCNYNSDAGAYLYGFQLHQNGTKVYDIDSTTSDGTKVAVGTYDVWTKSGGNLFNRSWKDSNHDLTIVKDTSNVDFALKEDSDGVYEIDYNFYSEYDAVSAEQDLKTKVFNAVVDASSAEGMTASNIDITVEIDLGSLLGGVQHVSLWDSEWGRVAVAAFGDQGDKSTEVVKISYKNTEYSITLKLIEERDTAEPTLNEAPYEVFMNGNSEAASLNEAAQAQLKADILAEIVASSDHNGTVTITAYDGEGALKGWYDIFDGNANFFVGTESIKIKWSGSSNYRDYETAELSIKVKDSRPTISITTSNVEISEKNEPTDVAQQVMDAVSIKATDPQTGIVSDVTVVEGYISYNPSYAWPANGAEDTFTVTVTVPTDATYIGATGTLTLKCTDTTILKTVIYTDGVEEVVVFEDLTIGYTEDDATYPDYTGDPDIRDYYDFAGWVDSVNGNTTTRTAQWSIKNDENENNNPDELDKFTVKFVNVDENGNVTVLHEITDLSVGAEVTSYQPTADQTPANKFFDQWDRTVVAVAAADAKDSDDKHTITYTAQWDDLCTVTFDGDELGEKVAEGTSLEAPEEPTEEKKIFKGWAVAGTTDIVSFPYTVNNSVAFVSVWGDDRNDNKVEDDTAADPFTNYVWKDADGTELHSANWLTNETVPTYTIEDGHDNGKMFTDWTVVETTADDGYTKTITYTANWVDDTNNNDVADSAETITVNFSNATVKVNGTEVVNGTATLYDSTAETATIVVTPDKGYYVEEPASLTTVKYEKKDVGGSWQGITYIADNRNIYTGTLTVESGKSYVVDITTAQPAALVLPVDEVTIKVNGYTLTAGLSITKELVLNEIYGEGNYTAGDYSGSLTDLSGIIVQIGKSCGYKITYNPDSDKYPDVSDTLTVHVRELRENAEITHTYVNGNFNTEDDFKAAFAETVKFNGNPADFEGLTDLDKNGEISWTANEDGTYTATVKAKNNEGWLETTETFSGLTWTVNKYGVTFVDEDGTVLLEKKEYDYGTPAANVELPAENPTKTGYTFDGWKVADVKGEATYTATYTINQYTYTVKTYKMDRNGEYGEPVVVTMDAVDYNTLVSVEPVIEEGFSLNAENSSLSANIPDNNDLVLNVYIDRNKYNVVWNWMDATGAQTKTDEMYFGAEIAAHSVERHYEVEEDGTTVRYYFQKWDLLVDGATVPVDGITYTAVYDKTEVYEVKFNADGGTAVNAQYVENGNLATEPNTTRNGYRFDGWYLDGAAYDFTTPVTEDIVLTAQWVQQVTVTFDVEGDDYQDQTFDIGGKATKPADPTKTGYVFGGWYLGENAFDFESEVNENVDLTAKWLNDRNNNGVDDELETITIITVEPTAADENADPAAISSSNEVEVSGNAMSIGDNKWIYDSTTTDTITIKATPTTHLSGVKQVSDTFVSSVTRNGDEQTEVAGYATDFSYSYTFAPTDGDEIIVTFAVAEFDYNDPRIMNYYAGMKNVAEKDLYEIIAKAPAYDKAEDVTITYKAREAMTHSISLDILKNGNTLVDGAVELLKKANIPGIIENGNLLIKMDALWLDVDVENNDPFPESVSLEAAVDAFLVTHSLSDLLGGLWDKIVTGKWTEVGTAISDFFAPVYESAMYYGAHRFGYNPTGADTITEKIKLTYKSDAMYIEGETTVDLKDQRIVTSINGNNISVVYRDYKDEDLVNLIAPVVVDKDGNVVEGVTVTCAEIVDPYTLEGRVVSDNAYEMNFQFAGNDEYRPSEATFTVTVTKADLSMDLPNPIVEYGEDYSTAPNYTMGNEYGIRDEIDESLIKFMIGLDIADLDIDGDGVHGLQSRVQLVLPADLQKVLDGILGLTGNDTTNGTEMSLSELMKYLEPLEDSTITVLKQAMEAISSITELGDITIVIGGKDPTDIGAYLYGAVSTNPNYETAFDVGYIVIKPDTTRVYLDWNYNDTNGIYTAELLQHVDLGASAYDDEAFETKNDEATALINNLFFGININGELVAKLYNAEVDPENFENELNNGAYTQMAFIAEFGNEFYYAVPAVRAFAIVPNIVDVQVVVDDAEVADVYTVTFDNAPVDVDAILTYDQGTTIPGGENGVTTYHYYGIRTNTNTYDSDVAPTNAGAYIVTATYTAKTGDKITALGIDVATLIIAPAESTIAVEDKVVAFTPDTKHDFDDQITAASAVEGVKPDTTVISAGINTDGDFSENGWEAINGTINVDFPKWVDELIAEYAPSVVDGITVKEFSEKLVGKLPDITAELEELGATNEIVNALTNAVTNVANVLAEVPENVTLSFKDDAYAQSVGAYVIVGIVTDSDHIPSADAGLLVITPDVTTVDLKWNHEDENNIWTRELLKHVDLEATAFDIETGAENEDATGKITYQFIGIDKELNLIVKSTENADELPNGAYIELAYIELEVDGQMTVGNLLAREVVIVPGTANVTFVDVNNNNARKFTFDNTPKSMEVKVTINGEVIDPADNLTVTYTGVQTNGVQYNSTTAPTQAGVYTVVAVYKEVTSEGSMANIGVAVGVMAIEPAESTIEVTGGTVTYDGNAHTAAVVATGSGVTEPDYTLISGGAYVSGNIDEIGVDAFHGNVNIDFPAWLDEALAEYEFSDGLNAVKLADYITAYRDELIALIPVDELVELGVNADELNAAIEKLNGYIDELLTVLEKLPEDVTLTFNDDVTYTEPGAYLYYGIVTDSDHYPSTDTGLLVIEKMDIVFDVSDTTVTWNGEEQMSELNNPKDADYVTVVIDREANSINIVLDQDAQYVLNTVAQILGVEFDGDVQMSTILEQYNGEEVAAAIVDLIAEAQKLNLPEEIQKVLTAVKAELETLPEDGTVTVNSELPSEIGEYEVYALSYSQYYKTSAAESILKIVPVQVEVVLDDNSKAYGEADPELTYTVNYYDHEGNKLADANAVNVTVTREEGENVGKYAITAAVVLTDDAHYELIAEPEDAVFEITPAELTITVDAKTKVYGDADPELTYTVSGLVNGDTAENLNIVVTREEGENVGTYAITATAESDNYKITVVDAELTINPAAITSVTATDTTYNGSEQTTTLTVTGVNGETLVEGTDYEIVSGNKATNAGTHTVTIKGLGNYTGECTAEWKIAAKAVTVTIKNDEITYGDKTPAVVLAYSDSAAEAELGLNITWNAPEYADAGEYKSSIAISTNKNWTVTYVGGVLTVKKAEVTVTIVSDEITYGEEVPAVELTYSNDAAKDEVKPNITWNVPEQVNAGEYTTRIPTDIYKNWIVSYVGGVLTVNKAEVTVTIVSDEITYGEEVPDVELTYSNDAAKEEVKPDITWDVPEQVNAGEYTTRIPTDIYKNWTVTYVGGKLTVNKAPVTVTAENVSKVYGMDDPTFTAAFEGLVEGDTLNVTFTRAEGEDVGTYAITPAVTEDEVSANYEIACVDGGKLYIEKAQITISVDGLEIDVDDEIPAQNPTVEGQKQLTYKVDVNNASVQNIPEDAMADLVAKLTEELGVKITATVKQNNAGFNIPGTYTNNVVYAPSDNYTVGINSGTILVTTGDYICWNTVTGEYFDDVTNAFDDADTANGHTIQMLANATTENGKNEAIIIVDAGTTFDLNGYYVQAGNLLSFGVVMDSAEVTGGIKISNKTSEAFTQLQPSNGGYLPIYDTSYGCYRFYAYSMSSFAARNHAADESVPEDGVKFRFRLSFTNEAAYKLLSESNSTGLDVVVVLNWTGLRNPLIYTMDPGTLMNYASDAYAQMQTSGKNTQVMYLTVSGLYNLESGGSISATPQIQSVTSVEGQSKIINYNIP